MFANQSYPPFSNLLFTTVLIGVTAFLKEKKKIENEMEEESSKAEKRLSLNRLKAKINI